ncbi:hypothetical protein CIP107503_02126 [Corynebacterium diphtheriae]|uniref:ABC-three component system middle component 7 n=1 Tax=Corynebacterium diphtheriae TaxID=1717 RepID=UPI00030C7715|nr:ABC-three component system middle component 7 [Corynebacterium diphtheriae]KJJ59267.1 hypothetical protein NG01_08450 [Corynebacterium diphtheriae]OFI54073.1 hypothetical protein BKD83_02690 [Corynebacterium diphtheriae]OSQ21213.1 hypothetical protein B1A52_03210 [Corynebacterium diphtheriae]OSQ27393.1 hypothetical protein B9J72_04150 [Corynebacterium diphtheriae]OWN39904.1 hypothetical protein AY510_07180 [Corynebacterium diphtheriae bv. gravis]
MRLPNKLFSFEESTLANLPVILEQLKSHPLGILELFRSVESTLGGPDEFLDTMMCLYALGAVEITDERQVIAHVGPAVV